MAIKFEDNTGDGKPAKKAVGGKTYGAEEPAPASPDGADQHSSLPFAKPVRADKKRKAR